MAFITVTDIRHRHLSTDDIHQINKSIKPFVADKKKKKKKNLPLYNLTLERTLMTCDLKKLGCFFFSLPEMKPSVLMMLAGMSTMLMWESVIRMHTTALAPGLLVKRDLNIQKWQSGLSHVKPETPRYHRVWGGGGVGMAGNWGGGLHQHSFVSGGVTHAPERRHTSCINQNLRCTPSALPRFPQRLDNS